MPLPLVLGSRRRRASAPATPPPAPGGPLALLLAMRRRRLYTPVAHPDLMAAVIAWMRANPDLVAAFGDGPSAPKFEGNAALALPALPYAVYGQLEEQLSAMSRDGAGLVWYVGPGAFVWKVFAATQRQAKDLARQIATALDDAPLVFDDGLLLELRPTRPQDLPGGEQGPGVPAQYGAAVAFRYVVQRTL